MLELENINVYYGKAHVLFDMSVYVKEGENCRFVGLPQWSGQDDHIEYHFRPSKTLIGNYKVYGNRNPEFGS